jgi:hypothetical protein
LNKQIEISDLKQKLDEIDSEVYGQVHDGYKQSRLRVLVGIWQKGEAVCDFMGVNPQANWFQLEKQTGRNHESLKSWHDLYQKYPDRQKYIFEYAEPKAEEWTKKALGQKWTALLESESPDWWTPEKYIKAIKEVMGEIDLDPASCVEANKIVKAKRYYSPKENGLLQPWEGRIFLNPPYGELTKEFAEKFFNDYESSFHEGIVLVNSRATDADWFQPFFNGVICFTDHRIDFNSPNEKNTSSTHGSCFIYFGPNERKFADVFSQFGNVVKRWPNA